MLRSLALVCLGPGQPGGKPCLAERCVQMVYVFGFSLVCVTSGSRPQVAPAKCRLISFVFVFVFCDLSFVFLSGVFVFIFSGFYFSFRFFFHFAHRKFE